jgi:hypothetical protein
MAESMLQEVHAALSNNEKAFRLDAPSLSTLYSKRQLPWYLAGER